MFNKHKTDILIIILLTALSAPLRFINLGYSEFQDDEKKAYIRLAKDQTVTDFLLQQRKGPMQFLATYIPYSITGDYRNELAGRLPFTLINTASVIVLYLLLKKLTKSRMASVFGAVLYMTNGFIVGFSRIAQYQNLNLFFSLFSLLFYADLMDGKKHLIRKSLLGTLFFCLSLLSHWDAIFYLVPVVYFFIIFLLRKDIPRIYKSRLTMYNFILGSLVLLPFMIPYVNYHTSNKQSTDYFGRRIGLSAYSFIKHRFIFELYNPFVTLPFYLSLCALSVLFVKKNLIYFVWFFINFILIRYFMAKPGTHIYNYVIPMIFLISFLTASVLENGSKIIRTVLGFGVFFIYAVFAYQSYMIFVDHKAEYPWDEKTIFNYTTIPYVEKEVLTFGFPHNRNWKGVNEFILNYNDKCSYITNEGKEVSQIYTDIKFGNTTKCHYIISVKRPFISTRDGIIYPGTGKNNLIYQYEKDDEVLTKVYFKNPVSSDSPALFEDMLLTN